MRPSTWSRIPRSARHDRRYPSTNPKSALGEGSWSLLKAAGDQHCEDAGAARDNAAVVRRAIDEIWNLGKPDLADLLFAPDYVNHGGLIPDLVRGPEAIKI